MLPALLQDSVSLVRIARDAGGDIAEAVIGPVMGCVQGAAETTLDNEGRAVRPDFAVYLDPSAPLDQSGEWRIRFGALDLDVLSIREEKNAATGVRSHWKVLTVRGRN